MKLSKVKCGMTSSEIFERLDSLFLLYANSLNYEISYPAAENRRRDMETIAHCASKLGVISAEDFLTIVKMIWNKKALRPTSYIY